MKVLIAQISNHINNFVFNLNEHKKAIEKAKEEKADLLLFPELSLVGYMPNDWMHYSNFIEEQNSILEELKKYIPKGLVIGIGFIALNEGLGKNYFNRYALMNQEGIIFFQDKSLLPNYDIFQELRYFEPAMEHRVFEYKGYTIGIAICEDIWSEVENRYITYAKNPVAELKKLGATLILAPSASPYTQDKQQIRYDLVRNICTQYDVDLIYSNFRDLNDAVIFDGYSFAVNSKGEFIALSQSIEEEYVSFHLKDALPVQPYKKNLYESLEEILTFAIKTYLKKTGFTKVHLGLSGGIDSALCAYLAVKALGKDSVEGFLMPSEYSSAGSIDDSIALAKNLGIKTHTQPIKESYNLLNQQMQALWGNTEFGLAQENLQSRLRGLYLMTHSNKTGSLLMSTGNKSEIAVGYCTLYGDMNGAFSPIGDLYKMQVFEFCNYINKNTEIIPFNILTKPPSAELRPDQKDEDSLPPYKILDAFLKDYIENFLSYKDLTSIYGASLVDKVIKLIKINEYKRSQGSLIFKLSKRSFNNDRNVPILSR